MKDSNKTIPSWSKKIQSLKLSNILEVKSVWFIIGAAKISWNGKKKYIQIQNQIQWMWSHFY
jgi:hypothetical protein